MNVEVTPSFARIDEILAIRVSGCRPLATIRVTLQMGEGDWQWSSHADFVADDDGTVDLSKSAPISGSYEGLDPMGLIWSMELNERGKTKLRSGNFEGFVPEVRINRTFRATSDGRENESIRNIAYYARAPVIYSAIREQGIVASMFHRPGSRRPGIIVLGGSAGGIPGFTAALLAAHGYTTLALGYFGLDGLPQELKEIPLEYFERAIDWFRSQPDVLPDSLGVVGTSRGGELALLLGSQFPEIRAVVSFVGSGIVLGALTQAPGFEQSPAWTWRGEPIPPLAIAEVEPQLRESGGSVPNALERLKDSAAIERASIPVEKINGPILLISGKQDALWSSTLLSEFAIARLRRSNFLFPYQHLAYPGAGHGISPPYHPTTLNEFFHPITRQLHSFGGDPVSVARACADSWKRALEFFRNYLARS
jgi:dienelactone hydrolase